MNYQNWTEEQKTAGILEALSREELSAELRESIQSWLLCGDGAEGQDQILDGILDRLFDERRRPGAKTYRSLARLHERLGMPPVKRRISPGRRWLRVAAVVVPLLALAGALWRYGGATTDTTPAVTGAEVARVEVVPDSMGRVTLPDGSTVRLSGDTKMTVAENFNENRAVHLSGQAFFSVARNEAKPFTVETDHLTVTVLGTEFNLEAYPDRETTVVSLASGRVEVTDESRSTVLTPLEQLVYHKRNGESSVAGFTPEQIDRWRFGERVLNDVSLPEALRAVAGFYGKKAVIGKGLPGNLGVTTVLKDGVSAESTLEAIRLMNDAFTYQMIEDTLYIEKK